MKLESAKKNESIALANSMDLVTRRQEAPVTRLFPAVHTKFPQFFFLFLIFLKEKKNNLIIKNKNKKTCRPPPERKEQVLDLT